MRACGACFWFRRDQPGGDRGECFNRPPHGYVINHGDPHDQGYPNLEVISIRPPVLADDYCNFFSHKEKEKSVGS
jgi:hypothetical protein